MSLNRLKLGMRKKEFIKPLGSHAYQKGRQSPIQLIEKALKPDKMETQLKENHNPQFKTSQIINLYQKDLNFQVFQANSKIPEKVVQVISENFQVLNSQIEYQRKNEVNSEIIIFKPDPTAIIARADPLAQKQQIQVEIKQCLKPEIDQVKQSIKPEQNIQLNLNNQTIQLDKATCNKIIRQNVQISSESLKIFIQQNTVLSQDVQQKRKQIDQLAFQNKKLEIQLLNANQNYYQKQMKRLKEEVEKLQESNEQYKHQYFVSTNNKKQLQANLSSKTQQVNLLLRQLEKQKIQNTELSYQIQQKDKLYKKIINQLENSQANLSNRFEETNKKYYQVDSLYKQKNIQLECLQTRYQSACKSLQESQQKLKINKQVHQIQLNRVKSSMSQLELVKRNLQRQSEATIQRLSEDLRMVKEQRQSFTIANQQRLSQIQNQNEKVCYEIQIVRLEEELKLALEDVVISKNTILQLTEKLKNFTSKSDYESLQKQYKLLNQKRIDAAKFYQNKLSLIQKQNQQLTLKLKSETSLSSEQPNSNKNQAVNFHQALKGQIAEKDKLKADLLKKSEQIYSVKQSLQQVTQKYQQIKMDLQISIKHQKAREQKKNIEKQISEQNLQNDIDSLKRKFSTIQKKLQSKARQNREKQQFIKNYIIGKSHEGTYLAKQLERIFLSAQKNSEMV